MSQIVIIGAGVVGLAVARELIDAGHAVTVVDRDPDGDRCSMGNAAGIAVTEVLPAASFANLLAVPKLLADPLGPLHIRPGHLLALMPWFRRFVETARSPGYERAVAALASINARAVDDTARMLDAIGQPEDLWRRGSFLIYEHASSLKGEERGFDAMRRNGVILEPVHVDDARAAEPALSEIVQAAVSLPQWCNVADPARVVRGLAKAVAARGTIVAGTVAGFERAAGPRSRIARVVCQDGRRIEGDHFIIAAGAWSAGLAAMLGERVLLEAERGYNATLPAPGIQVNRLLTIAERHFVASPLSIGLRIGGAAEFAGLDRPGNLDRSRNLVRLARPYFKSLDDTGAKLWFGNRPSTPDGRAVISRSRTEDNVIHAFGHGHLGLTQSATTARLVLDLLEGREPPIDLTPFDVGRFAAR